MRVALDFYYDDLEQRCVKPECGFINGSYSEELRNCPRCSGRLAFFRAFGTEEERSTEVQRWQARVLGDDY